MEGGRLELSLAPGYLRAPPQELAPKWEQRYGFGVRVIARSNLIAFARRHPETGPALRRWELSIRSPKWATLGDAGRSFSGCKVLNHERIRFEIAGGNYRLIAAFDLVRGIAFIKFIGTHADYDRIGALTVSQF